MSERSPPTGDGRVELVLSPRAEAETLRDCLESLRSAPDSSVLVVAFRLTPRDVVASLRRTLDTTPSGIAIVSVGEWTRSAAARSGPRPSAGPTVNVTTVASLDDFSRLVTVVDLHLQSLDGHPTVYVGALGPLFEHGTTRTVFRMLHLLTNRIRAADASAHVFLDPDAVGLSTAKTVEPLFDAVRDEGADGDPDDTVTLPPARGGFGDVLDTPVRKWLVAHLRDQPGPVPIERLADRLAEQDGSGTDKEETEADRLRLALHHEHVPKLVEAGLVVTDEDHEFVEATRTAERVNVDGSSFSNAGSGRS